MGKKLNKNQNAKNDENTGALVPIATSSETTNTNELDQQFINFEMFINRVWLHDPYSIEPEALNSLCQELERLNFIDSSAADKLIKTKNFLENLHRLRDKKENEKIGEQLVKFFPLEAGSSKNQRNVQTSVVKLVDEILSQSPDENAYQKMRNTLAMFRPIFKFDRMMLSDDFLYEREQRVRMRNMHFQNKQEAGANTEIENSNALEKLGIPVQITVEERRNESQFENSDQPSVEEENKMVRKQQEIFETLGLRLKNINMEKVKNFDEKVKEMFAFALKAINSEIEEIKIQNGTIYDEDDCSDYEAESEDDEERCEVEEDSSDDNKENEKKEENKRKEEEEGTIQKKRKMNEH